VFFDSIRNLSIARAENDLLFDRSGQQYIDLLGGGGTCLLGHANRVVGDAIQEQLHRVWISGVVPTPPRSEAVRLIEACFPDKYRVACIYSTGMEAAEFALRVARVATGRSGVVGFRNCMHGKSTVTASLGWPSDLVNLPDLHSLPYLRECSESEVLSNTERVLAGGTVGSLLLEPLMGSGGGFVATPSLAHGLADLCAKHGALMICDEIFTGFHRTGPRFLHQELGISPDIVLMGKALGNGFPVSAVVVDVRHEIRPEMLPNSTYSGNALGASAIVATLGEMGRLDLAGMVRRIGNTIQRVLSPLQTLGAPVRGKGALWVIELPSASAAAEVGAYLLDRGVMASVAGRFVRLLPAATIAQEHLEQACRIVREACEHVLSGGRR
jgi:acetylornithine/succinyldiaminopimelate/putrescine aminotransferase